MANFVVSSRSRFARFFIFNRKKFVPKFATSCSRGTLVVIFRDVSIKQHTIIMDSISSINKNGYKVFELIISKPIQKTTRSPEQKRQDEEAGIPTLQMVEGSISQFSNLDIFNNNINIGAQLENEEILIDESDYKHFKLLVEQFLSIEYINRIADYKFIVKVAFDWMIELYIKNVAAMELYDFVVNEIEKATKKRHYDFIIKALKIQTPFQVGNCHFHQLSESDSLKIFDTTSAEASKNDRDLTLEEWNKMFKSFVNTPLATVNVFGVDSKCVELAKKEINIISIKVAK